VNSIQTPVVTQLLNPAQMQFHKTCNIITQNIFAEQTARPAKIVLVRIKSDVTNTKWIDDFIVSIRGGSEKDEKLIRSILYKLGESNLDVASINKILGNIFSPIVSNQDLLRLLSELEKPFNPELGKVSPTLSNDILGFAKNVEANQHKSKSSSSIFAEALSTPTTLSPVQKRVQRNRALNLAKKEPTLTPTMLKASQVPTAEMFSADARTGVIQDINIAFKQFQTRMTEIGNQYTGGKQKYFLKLLDECSIDRFKALSTESGRLTIFGVREAGTMLQSEFEGYHEPNSITRMTDADSAAKNKLDGRFRKGLLSGEPDTLNQEFTDLDVKILEVMKNDWLPLHLRG